MVIIRPLNVVTPGEFRAIAISVSMVTTIVCQPQAVSFKSGPFNIITLIVPSRWVRRLAIKAKKRFPMAQIVNRD
ncbi:hypothetical protein OPS25_09945 [Alteromonas ponticola]|uniref:Uncharacterized protein n=1 Tax=Alteromonas aquimaris TaxID=2998417 RepID=A0ABT3P7W4_9ALTE|nr:hypothetical protein [Alteromonas aquimaris]MCW8108814.1 hypothetical protein [Alteromonas aquimaris]